MTEAERLRAALAGAAAAGPAAPPQTAPLRALLQRVDATILPRRLTAAAHDPGAALVLDVAARRIVALVAPAPDGLPAPDAALFGASLDFADPAAVAAIARVLSAWDAGLSGPVRLTEAALAPGAHGARASPGVAAGALAQALGLHLWPDRTLPARLEAWVTEVMGRVQALVGYGALGDAGIDAGDPADLAAALAEVAPDGPGARLAAALAGPAGGDADEAAPALAVLALRDGRLLAVAGAPEGGVAALADPGALSDLVGAWQAA
jgi:hypothetical protein